MELVTEIIGGIFEEILDSAICLAMDKSAKKRNRILAFVFVMIFFLGIILGLLIIGIVLMKESILAGVLIIAVSVIIAAGLGYKLKKSYDKAKK